LGQPSIFEPVSIVVTSWHIKQVRLGMEGTGLDRFEVVIISRHINQPVKVNIRNIDIGHIKQVTGFTPHRLGNVAVFLGAGEYRAIRHLLENPLHAAGVKQYSHLSKHFGVLWGLTSFEQHSQRLGLLRGWWRGRPPQVFNDLVYG
jgi:hypothetical protein